MQAKRLRPVGNGHALIQRAYSVLPSHEPGAHITTGSSGTPQSDVSGHNSDMIISVGTLATKTVIHGGRGWKYDGTAKAAQLRSSFKGAETLTKYTFAFTVRSPASPVTTRVRRVIGVGGIVAFNWDHTSAAFAQAWSHSDGGFKSAKLTTTLQPCVTYQITGTYDGTNIRCYLNGVLEATTAAGAPAYGGSLTVFIGAQGSANAIDGDIGAVVVLPYALPSKGVADLYAQMTHNQAHLGASFLRRFPMRLSSAFARPKVYGSLACGRGGGLAA